MYMYGLPLIFDRMHGVFCLYANFCFDTLYFCVFLFANGSKVCLYARILCFIFKINEYVYKLLAYVFW